MHLSSIAACLAVTCAQGVAAQELEPVSSLNGAAYLGRWFQTHASFTVKYTFELGGNCVTAEYKETNRPGVVSVRNIVRPLQSSWFDSLVSLPEIKITGNAVQSPTEPGKLQVSLGPNAEPEKAGQFKPPGNYWIVRLGPIKSGKYEWAVVSGPRRQQLYILARDPVGFEATYEKAVLKEVKALGFTEWYNKPLETNQKDCGYGPESWL